MSEADARWRPSASLETIKARARLNAAIRAFFSAREVLEVETPILSAAATVDRHIESYAADDGRWLQTSPEFAMKRLVAAGSGPIWQLARVFRREECGRYHNPEFSLLEWYRPHWDHHRLMDEVEELLAFLDISQVPLERLSYRDAVLRHAGLDPFSSSLQDLRAAAHQCGVADPQDVACLDDRDFWLDTLMSLVVAPALGRDAPVLVYDFPASQAALARIRPGEPAVAERFELFWRGVELANGFHELSDAAEQRARFAADRAWRQQHRRVCPPADAQLIDALAAGFPDCAGVALGVDRLLQLMCGASELQQVLAFGYDRA